MPAQQAPPLRFNAGRNATPSQLHQCTILNFIHNINFNTFVPTRPEMDGDGWKGDEKIRLFHEQDYDGLRMTMCIYRRFFSPSVRVNLEWKYYEAVVAGDEDSDWDRRVEARAHSIFTRDMGGVGRRPWDAATRILQSSLVNYRTNGNKMGN